MSTPVLEADLTISSVVKSSVNVLVVSLEIEIPKPENPWLRFAGIFKDDPTFNRMREDIAEYRREKDAELENYYNQIEIEMEESKEEVRPCHTPKK